MAKSVEELEEELRLARNEACAARALLHEHYDARVRIWNPKRGGWLRFREDHALVQADPPKEALNEYARGWEHCRLAILSGLSTFKTQTSSRYSLEAAAASVNAIRNHLDKLVPKSPQ